MTYERLATERLLLRPWTEDDADAVLAILSDERVWPWLGAEPKPVTDLDTARRVAGRWGSLGEGVLRFWAIETPGIEGLAPQPVGSVLLLTLPRSDDEPSSTVEVGWHLHPSAWGRGIVTEAARAVLGLAREAGLAEVHAVVYPGNDRSLAVCDRLGMTRVGLSREWYGVEFIDHTLAL